MKKTWWKECVAVHGNRVYANMDEQFHAVGGGDTHRVFGVGDGGDLPVEGGGHNSGFGPDAYALPQNACGKGLVGNLLGGDDHTGHGGVRRAGLALDRGDGGLDGFLFNRSCFILAPSGARRRWNGS